MWHSMPRHPHKRTHFSVALTWKMAYIMHVSGLFWENSDTVKMLSPHLLRSSSSCG